MFVTGKEPTHLLQRQRSLSVYACLNMLGKDRMACDQVHRTCFLANVPAQTTVMGAADFMTRHAWLMLVPLWQSSARPVTFAH